MPSRSTPSEAGINRLGAILNLFLDRLEEWLIATLIGAATVVTFVAVVHRYGASNSAGLARWAGAHGFVLLRHGARRRQSLLGAGARHLHVRLDGEIWRCARRTHRHPCR